MNKRKVSEKASLLPFLDKSYKPSNIKKLSDKEEHRRKSEEVNGYLELFILKRTEYSKKNKTERDVIFAHLLKRLIKLDEKNLIG